MSRTHAYINTTLQQARGLHKRIMQCLKCNKQLVLSTLLSKYLLNTVKSVKACGCTFSILHSLS